jgi:hypothetical protein
MPTRAELVATIKAFIEQKKGDEEAIAFLRAQGCSKVESIAVLNLAMGINLGRAKSLVHFSETWKDVRAKDEQFHEDLEKKLKDMHE